MNVNAVAKNYACLTPEERFRLIFSAGARADEAEQARLRNAGQRITLSMEDHAPWSHGFDELAKMVFLEMLEEAAKHHDAFECWCETEESLAEDDGESVETGAEDVEEKQDEPACVGVAPADDDEERSIPARTFHLYLAQGFMLKTKIAGWKLFCDRLSIPPFALWKILPGFERLQRALQRVEGNQFGPGAAFVPEGMLRWLGRIRPKGHPEPAMEDLISPERFAEELDTVFRERVEWWGG